MLVSALIRLGHSEAWHYTHSQFQHAIDEAEAAHGKQ